MKLKLGWTAKKAFIQKIGRPPKKNFQCSHPFGTKTNNTPLGRGGSNLEWGADKAIAFIMEVYMIIYQLLQNTCNYFSIVSNIAHFSI